MTCLIYLINERTEEIFLLPFRRSLRAMIKTDTIVDFLQVILKIIIQNLQISNTSASQNNKQKEHQKTTNIFEREQSSWGLVLSKTKTRDTDVILSPSFPQAVFSREPLWREV